MFELLPNLKVCAFDIACKYGYKHRMINCIEELSELQKEKFCKNCINILKKNNML
jgi:hypothetical protein